MPQAEDTDTAGILCVGARDAPELPAVQGSAPTTKNVLAQNVNSVEIEECWAVLVGMEDTGSMNWSICAGEQ